MRSRYTEFLIVAVTAACLAVVLTWPLAARLATAGRIDTGDGRYSIWNVAWVAHALTTKPLDLFQANIFYPYPNALAFSEANLFAGLLAVPVWLATKNALAAANWVILCAFTLAAICGYYLIRRLTHSRAGATVGALMFAYSPFAFSHIPHVQLLMTFGLALALWRMHVFVDDPRIGNALALGAAMAVQALACAYYGVFGGLAGALGVAWFGLTGPHRRSLRYWLLAVVAGATFVAIVLPFFVPYLAVRADGFSRSLDDARLSSANWTSYLASPILLHRWMLPFIGTWKDVLFPGYLAIGLSIFLIVRLAIGSRTSLVMAPRVIGFYVLLCGTALWASFGPDAGLYRVLHETLPVFSMLRAPSRFGVLVGLAFAVLSGGAVASITRPPITLRRRWLALVVLAYAFARSTAGPLTLFEMPPEPRAYKLLANLPSYPVVAFPYFAESRDRHRHTSYMLMATKYWKPLLNGYSDHIPGEAFEDMAPLSRFPEPAAWRVLRDRHARFVLVHWSEYGDAERAALTDDLTRQGRYLRPIVHPGSVSLFEIVGWPAGND
jgi:hypothetical protein